MATETNSASSRMPAGPVRSAASAVRRKTERATQVIERRRDGLRAATAKRVDATAKRVDRAIRPALPRARLLELSRW